MAFPANEGNSNVQGITISKLFLHFKTFLLFPLFFPPIFLPFTWTGPALWL